MTLVISPYGSDDLSFDGDTSFGFERYRTDLWGTDAVRSTGASLIPQLASGDVYVDHGNLDMLETEARSILEQAEAVALEVFDPDNPGEGATVVDGELHDAFGGRHPARSIERYVGNLIRCIAIARSNECGVVIW